ncbi:rho GTPase activating protein 22 [Lentinula guzmanii]|uniref:Rho GTPase activating protein 22 n=1 Tax=Lentinula guzmanii TaxID=2804957 RepID=A0AA38MWV0_9AGAR|nr:rho GTPase activating protein 22 [Lentinula guzmanii]
MAPKRAPLTSNTLSPQDLVTTSNGQPTITLGFPRSTSPSNGFTNFLSKPSKWFGRSASNPKISTTAAASEPRASSSSGRKHKISRPTDPRPILDSYSVAPGARSVMDLSSRNPNSLDLSTIGFNSSQPSSPSSPLRSTHGLGDLRTISRRGWSKSADDLSKLSADVSPSMEEKIAQYRNRSNSNTSPLSSGGLPSAPPSFDRSLSQGSGVQPFPSLALSRTNTPSSATPTVSISISAPVMDEASSHKPTPSPTHVHTRSHSFTPKLASKLSAPRFIPPSPKRKGSAGSEVEGTFTPNILTRGAFPFSSSSRTLLPDSSSSSSILQPIHRSTALLAPPNIVELSNESAEFSSPKRSSQIVYNSGFINKFADGNATPHQLGTSKAWKPFKLELKGSKLYFYKPPSDRAAAVRELFPTELVPANQQDEDQNGNNGGAEVTEPEDDPFAAATTVNSRMDMRLTRPENSLSQRKKRAFWGRRTHPDLSKSSDRRIEKGSFEALTHEAVFGTTFFGPAEEEASAAEIGSGNEKARIEPMEQWKDFAASILLCMPYLVDEARFEAELMRCCEYLVTGAEEDQKSAEKKRVVWLAAEYLRYHGRPLEFPDWPEWKSEIAPEASATVVPLPVMPLPRSTSTQAVFNPTPVASPNIGMFSPRPEENSKLSIFDALGESKREGDLTPQPGSWNSYFELTSTGGPSVSTPLGTPSSPNGNKISWASALDGEGLSRDVLLLIDPNTIARSLSVFHHSALQKLPENLTADFLLNPEGSESHLSSSTQQPSSSVSVTSFAPLFGSDDHPHWLTKLLLVQILGADTSTGYATLRSSQLASPNRRSEDRGPTSRTHSRSEVISAWVKIGELCRLNGDECSWKAILHAICAAPVARLEKAWKRVNSTAIATVESWVQLVKDGDFVGGIKQPKITTWGGDMRNMIRENLSQASEPGTIDDVWMLAALDKVRLLFEGFRTSVSLCPRNPHFFVEKNGEEVQKIVSYWTDIVADGGVSGGLGMKFQRVEQFNSLSLAAEPRRKGLYEPFYWARSNNQSSSTAPLLPLLFPEPLPTITLLDRTQLRGRVDSDSTDFQHLRAVDGHLRPEGRKPVSATDGAFAVLNQGGTTIPVHDGDLLLVVQNPISDSPSTGSRPSSLVRSRPPSSDIDSLSFLDGKIDKPNPIGRKPSIRVKPGSSPSVERKNSVARRNSLPSLSQRQPLTLAENSSEPPLRVLVQAGTLDRLVDVLVHGLHNVSVSVADDNGEMSLRVGMTRELLLDHKEFTRVWWNVFRSFVTPLIFFELLRKIYIKSQPVGSSPLPDQYLAVISSKSRVLDTLKLWLTKGGGAQDVLDDSQLLQALRTFFSSSSDHNIHSSAATFEDSNVRQAWDNMTESRQTLEQLLRSQSMRPSNTRTHALFRNTVTTTESRVRNLSTREPPDIDSVSPEEFVDNIDGMAFAAFNNVTEEDLYITSDLLEVQSTDRTGWFPPREAPSIDEYLEIQTIYSHIQDVEPSSLISELSPESLYRLLPPGIRSCIRAHSIIRKWLISKIVAPRIGIRTRQARLEFVLQVIEVARLRNSENAIPNSLSEQPCVRSFVEAAVTSAILSPECRMYYRAWQNVAAGRGCSHDTLSQLLARPKTQSVASKEPLTVDMGWLIERILDVIAMPDLVESHNEEGQNLVNFDKRRNLCNFISNAPSLLSRRLAHQNDINRRGFERLNNIEREIFSIQFDIRGIRDEAYREGSAANVPGTPSKKISRPFQKLVALQMDKHRRDRNLRVRLQKEKTQEQSRNEKREEQLNKAMKGGRRPTSVAQKQHRNKKSMSSLFSFMRPISSAFGADTSHPPVLKRTASELDFAPSGKPTLVLNLTDSSVIQFINNDRSFTFRLDTEDGGHYLLQALSKRDMTKWIDTLTRVSRIAAKRRLTYIGNSPKPQVADHIHDQPITATRDPKAVFGVELNFLLERENGGRPVPPGTIPSIIEHCLAQVESRGLSEVGIYRMAGATSEIAQLKEAFNRGENPLNQSIDIHAICDLIKSWFRVLPEPLFPPESYHEAIDIIKLDNLDERLTNIRKLIRNLPRAHFDLLKLISEHLDRVTDFEEQNQMTAEALSIVFSPNLLRAPQNDFLMVLSNMPHTHKLVKTLITHFHVIFDDADPDPEADPEDELETPIAEADEDDEDDERTFTSYLPSTSPSRDEMSSEQANLHEYS